MKRKTILVPLAFFAMALTLSSCIKDEAPNSEADIVISYDPAAALATELRTILIVEGIEASPTERMITITITK